MDTGRPTERRLRMAHRRHWGISEPPCYRGEEFSGVILDKQPREHKITRHWSRRPNEREHQRNGSHVFYKDGRGSPALLDAQDKIGSCDAISFLDWRHLRFAMCQCA